MKKKGNGKKNRSTKGNAESVSPTERLMGNTPKRNKFEFDASSSSNVVKNTNEIVMERICIDNVDNQVKIENSPLVPSASEKVHNRLEAILIARKGIDILLLIPPPPLFGPYRIYGFQYW